MAVTSIVDQGLKLWHHSVESPRARLLLCHGLGEHSGRYLEVIQLFNQLRIEVFRFDLRGCGESEGKRQWITRFSDYTEDLRKAYHWMNGHSRSSIPTFIFGHSLGGAITSFFLPEIQQEIKAALFSAPAYLPGNILSPITIWVAKGIEKLLPQARLKKPLDTGQISKIPFQIDRFNEDPLCYKFYTLRQGNEILRNLPKVPSNFAALHIPFVIFHGSIDPIIRIEGSAELLRRSPAKDKELIVLPAGVHEAHHDTVKEQYFQELKIWLERQLSNEPTT